MRSDITSNLILAVADVGSGKPTKPLLFNLRNSCGVGEGALYSKQDVHEQFDNDPS